MMEPARDNRGKAPRSKAGFLPSPTKGWYVGDNLSTAPPGTAYVLNNAFPQLDYVRMRGGSTAYATGMTNAAVTTLMTYNAASSSKFFASVSGSIYDVTSGGPVGAAAVTGLNSNAVIEYTQFTNAGASWLICVNGVDAAQLYSTSGGWTTTPAITGLTGAGTLSYLWSYKNRLYGFQPSSLLVWYLGVNSIGGAATSFDLSGVVRYGGYLVAGGSWATVSLTGPQALWFALTSEGEVIIYSGLNPSDSSWSLQGIYKISKPLGKRCIMLSGGDVAIMTEDGIVPLSQVMSLDQVALQNVALSKPIAPAWRNAVIARQGISGWQIIHWPLQSMGVINLPKANAGDKTQFVANTRTGAWAQYLGWDSNCFAVYNNNLYYGSSDGRVMQAETGGQDDGANYTWTVFPSYTDLGSPANTKHVKMIRPRLQGGYSVTPQVSVKVDFDTTLPPQPTASVPGTSGALWDSAIWDSAVWPPALLDLSYWKDAEGFGATVSPVIQLTLSTSVTPDVRLNSIEILYETGSPLG